MRTHTRLLAVGTAVAVAAIGASVITALPASAATGCRVVYSVGNEWSGGFGANVTVTNLGDPIAAWTLVWSYSADQRVTQAWNAVVTQSGSQITARDAGYNAALATNATTSFGFNGSATGGNPAPTTFTLNGTTCTGGVSGPTNPTTPPTTGPTQPPTNGVPGNAAWVASGPWDTWTNNGYTVINNIWGSGAGAQTIWARTGTNWGVVANHPRTGGVKSYPHTGKVLNRRLSTLSSVRSSFNVSVANDGDYATAYDIWANNFAYEVMIWANQNGAVGPIAESYDANGAVPSARNVNTGGHTWNVYRGSNGSNAVFSFVRTGETNSASIDVLAIMNWLRTQGWWGDVTVGDIQFGFELTGTAGQSGFVCNSFSLDFT